MTDGTDERQFTLASKVSILTPCYNSAKYVGRLLDSVLVQDYPNIEMFAVDDGSTDDTCRVIESYVPKFRKRGYSLTLLCQPHGGQSVAIDAGLKQIKGKYLIYPDSDDWYCDKTAISTLVSTLEAGGEDVSMARCLPLYVDSLANPCKGLPINGIEKEYLFDDFLFNEGNFMCCSGAYMLKVGKVDELIGNRTIATAKNAGQNYQLLLPLLYRHRCLTVKEKMIAITVRADSHSRGFYRTYSQLKAKNKDFYGVKTATIRRMVNMEREEKNRCLRLLRAQYRKRKRDTYFAFHPRAMRIKQLGVRLYLAVRGKH